MSDARDSFFTTVGCMDGRVQEPIAKFGREKFDAQFPDTITEAGLVGLLASNDTGSSRLILESVKKKILISLEKHHSRGIIVHGHQDCAGNLVSDDVHKKQIKKAAEFISSLVSNISVIPVFVEKIDVEWKVRELA